MMEGKWSKATVFVYCGGYDINVQGTQKLIDGVNNKLALQYHTSNYIQEIDTSNTDSIIVDFKRNKDKYKL